MKKQKETERNRKKQEETGRNRKKLGENRKKQEDTGRNWKKQEDTGRNRKSMWGMVPKMCKNERFSVLSMQDLFSLFEKNYQKWQGNIMLKFFFGDNLVCANCLLLILGICEFILSLTLLETQAY